MRRALHGGMTPPAAPLRTTLALSELLTPDYLRYYGILPIERTNVALRVIATGGIDADVAAHLVETFQLPLSVEPVPRAELDRAISLSFDGRVALAESLSGDTYATEQDSAVADARDLALQPPVIRLVNTLIRDAIRARASDVHFESTTDGLTVRIRVDGVLAHHASPPRSLAAATVSRLKLLADLNIAEHRRPQDGRVRLRLDDSQVDVRVSTVPTMHGESVVLRLLAASTGSHDLDVLGVPAEVRPALMSVAGRTHGLLIATGPTGSGKTTTLHALLTMRATGREKVITVEDPVEYQVDGVTQVPVIAAAGMTFATALRSILRQDPDVVMVGEMRDRETAAIAAQAALTGHLVLSSLHTNDAASAITRLLDIGLEPFLISSTLQAVLAQRLVRKLCPHCRTRGVGEEPLPGDGRGSWVRAPNFYTSKGCDQCRATGYHGRTGIYELLLVTPALRTMLATSVAPEELREAAESRGMCTMYAHAAALVRSGITSPAEVRRVLGETIQ